MSTVDTIVWDTVPEPGDMHNPSSLRTEHGRNPLWLLLDLIPSTRWDYA